MRRTFAALLSLAVLAGAACAQGLPAPIPLAMPMLPAKGGAKLVVTSPAFKDGRPIPLANTAYGENKFPGLAWSGAPGGTKSFAIIMQDSDPPPLFALIQTILHWTMFNVPATTAQLDAGIAAPPAGAVDGANMRGKSSFYAGPHPPAGGPVHHYHFQVFALDASLALTDGAKFTEITGAMKDHVLASGELVGTYQGPAKP